MITESYRFVYGTSYENSLNLDRYVSKHDGGLPDKKVRSSDKTSNGAILSRLNQLGGYKGKMQITCIDNADYLREAILKICQLPSYIPVKLERTRIINGVTNVHELECQIQLNQGEKYSGGYAVSTFDINIFSENTYFVSASETTHNLTLSEEMTISNSGFNVYPQFLFSLTEDCESIEIKLYEGYGIKVEYPFEYGDVVEIDNYDSEISVYLNDALLSNVIVEGSAPFEILPGSNTLYYDGGDGDLIISYYETAL